MSRPRLRRADRHQLARDLDLHEHELRQMLIQGSGAIVNCSSLGGLVGQAGRGTYHATKHGVIGLTKSAAMDYAPRGIRINAVCPGVIATPMSTDLIENQPDGMKEIMRDQPIGPARPARRATPSTRLADVPSGVLIGADVDLRATHPLCRGVNVP